MRREAALAAILAALIAAPACGGDDDGGGGDAGPGVTFAECADSDQAFVRASFLALLGRRPRSQAEVQVYADLMAQTRALPAPDGEGAAPPPDPREVAARAILDQSGYVERWTEHFMDALRLARIEDQSFGSCYGVAHRRGDEGIADGGLAAHLRDTDPRDGGDGLGPFTMLDVLRSSLHLDDVSVLYRAHLFPLVSRPIPAANVPPVEAELARREDFGLVFDSAYLNRDLVCLGCHNSEAAVTDHPDPALDRHFPIAGHLEKALYGDSTGVEPARAHAMFRFSGFSAGTRGDGGGVHPWGIDLACGELYPDGMADDPAGVDGKFGGLTGDRLTVFELERSLARGVAALADGGLAVAPDGTIADPDQAFAYLVAMSVVESVWREVMGSSLTIANYFPRNQAAAELLFALTERFVASGFSLRELLIAIVTTDYFNRLPPEAGCGDDGPYDMPNVFDPWVTAEADEAMRRNGAADGVVPLSARTLVRAAFDALVWPRPEGWDFPLDAGLGNFCAQFYTCEQMQDLCAQDGTCCESFDTFCAGAAAMSPEQMVSFQKGVGAFLKNGERGFRGLDFQARLVWEDVFGRCDNLGDGQDFVAALVARAGTTAGATVGDVAAALKDRLVGEARIHHGADGGASEAAALEALFGAPLDAPTTQVADLEGRTRALCGVLLSTPQFLMSGMSPPESAYVPLLTAPEDGYDAVCAEVADRGLPFGLGVTCEADGLVLTPAP